MLRLGQMIYYVPDVKRSVEFYNKAFGLEIKFMDPTGQYAEMQTGETSLAFAALDLALTNLPNGFRPFALDDKPAACAMTFLSKDVHASLAKALESGAVEVAPLEEKPWGQMVSYVRDPDGILIEISSEMHICVEC